MAPSKPPIPSAATPKHGDHFDAWNSSATGHQRAENRLNSSTGWRQSRSMKLSCQLKSGATGGKRISDLVGAGLENWDQVNALRSGDVRPKPGMTVADMLLSKGKFTTSKNKFPLKLMKQAQDTVREKTNDEPHISERRIFRGLTVYINGSTAPLISDHKLKHLLAEHGAKISIHLGRRQVTHVILGNSCTRAISMGAGGGLAAAKIQKEIKRIGGCGIRYISVEWVLESLKAGIRLPEARFSNLAVSSKGQRSVYGDIFKAEDAISDPTKDILGPWHGIEDMEWKILVAQAGCVEISILHS